ncbi:MAG: universal stress protein [Deltaproteobacteria bacterium]|nr:universal stress protein [Deltaproteobacteria bacterium]
MAYPYRSVLSPIELDDPSLVALGVAQRIAADHEATLHLLHVVPRLPGFGEPDVVANEHSVAEEKARARLTEIANLHLKGVKHQIHTAAASLRAMAKAIVHVAGEVNADLIVLKTSGRKGLSNFILGNVAEEVVRTAPCPVLTLAPTAQEKAAQLGLREVPA